jgi:phage FluMu protein Com
VKLGKYHSCSYCKFHYPIGTSYLPRDFYKSDNILEKEALFLKNEMASGYKMGHPYLATFICFKCKSLHVREQQVIYLEDEAIHMKNFFCGECRSVLIEASHKVNFMHYKCGKCKYKFTSSDEMFVVIE